MDNECNCILALNGDKLVSKSEIVDYIKNDYDLVSKNGCNFVWTQGKEVKTPLSPLDYLDRRKYYLILFYFCPYCGKKINLKKIKEKLKNVEIKKLCG